VKGGLCFTTGQRIGADDGAIDADDGKVLRETVVGGMIVNSTISYAANGKQYVIRVCLALVDRTPASIRRGAAL
jgi:hypothetical protein